MVKLTVVYTLPQGADHEAFLKWRTTEHQQENMGMPGVIKSDFYAVKEIYSHENDSLDSRPLTFRYVTEAYWPDMKSFKTVFFDEEYQKILMESLKKIANPMFIVSEEVLSEEN